MSSSSFRNNNAGAARQQFTRSSPIAIKRSSGYDSSGIETSDDEDDESLVDVERDAVKLGLVSDTNDINMSRSLPSRLLRAPRLGSVPTNEDYISYRNIPSATLPPPMTLNDQSFSLSGVLPEQTTSYGSLRESNMKGTFFDGPSSYRDSRTGDIRRLEQRVRFTQKDDSSETQGGESSCLSIRDRIKKAREKKEKEAADAPKKPTSSLAAMFDGNEQSDTKPSAEDAAADFQNRSFMDSSPFYETALPSGALSTSLTGLEMLQRGLRLATITDHDSHSDDQLSRDANTNGHHGVLSRSLSDTRGTGRRLAETQRSPAMISANQGYQLHSTSTFIPPLSLGSAPASAQSGPAVSHLSTALQPTILQQESMGESRPDADIEGAFEMDLDLE